MKLRPVGTVSRWSPGRRWPFLLSSSMVPRWKPLPEFSLLGELSAHPSSASWGMETEFLRTNPHSVTVTEAVMTHMSLDPVVLHGSLSLESEDTHTYKQAKKKHGTDVACIDFGVTSNPAPASS